MHSNRVRTPPNPTRDHHRLPATRINSNGPNCVPCSPTTTILDFAWVIGRGYAEEVGAGGAIWVVVRHWGYELGES